MCLYADLNYDRVRFLKPGHGKNKIRKKIGVGKILLVQTTGKLNSLTIGLCGA